MLGPLLPSPSLALLLNRAGWLPLLSKATNIHHLLQGQSQVHNGGTMGAEPKAVAWFSCPVEMTLLIYTIAFHVMYRYLILGALTPHNDNDFFRIYGMVS